MDGIGYETPPKKIEVCYMLKRKGADHDGLPKKHEERRVSKLNRDQCINMLRRKMMQ